MRKNIDTPKVFISYAWGDEAYQKLVLSFAKMLVTDGIDVILDKWNLKEGNDTYAFMEKCVTDPSITNVLILLDPIYARKANEHSGGVGTETQIISPKIYKEVMQEKFIPVVMKRGENGEVCKPAYLEGRLYFDLSQPTSCNINYRKLVKTLFGEEIYHKPALGKKPNWVEKPIEPMTEDSFSSLLTNQTPSLVGTTLWSPASRVPEKTEAEKSRKSPNPVSDETSFSKVHKQESSEKLQEKNEVKNRHINEVVAVISCLVAIVTFIFGSGILKTLSGNPFDSSIQDLSKSSELEIPPVQYTVYFDSNGGDSTPTFSTIVYLDRSYGTLPVPVRPGYRFIGWYTNKAGGTEVTETTTVTMAFDHTLYARWMPESFTVTFNKNDTDSEPALLAQTTLQCYYSQELGTLPTPTRENYSFDGWYTDTVGGTKVTAATVYTAVQDITLYAHWNPIPLSGWVKASDAPSGARIESRKWTYTKTITVESTEASLSGYTQIGSNWVQSDVGYVNYASFPSGFDTNHSIYTSFLKSPLTASETSTTKRVVTNTWAGYVYWHWMYDTNCSNGFATRPIYNMKGSGPANGFYYKYFGAWTSETDYPSGGTEYCNDLGILNYIRNDMTDWSDCQGSTRWFRFDYYTSSYVDYYKLFQYQMVEDLESTTQVTAGTNGNVTISNVQEWVVYRSG